MSDIVSQKISLLPINKQSFGPGEKVIFELPADLGFLKASSDEDSYLAITLRNNSTLPTRWMLSGGPQSLIRDVAVFSLQTGEQLDFLDNYNQVLWHLNQNTKVVKTNEQSMMGMMSKPFSLEIDSSGNPQKRYIYSDGTNEDVYNSVFSPLQTDGSPAKLDANRTNGNHFMGYTVLVPLKLGIFNSFGEAKLCPLIYLEGIRIEMTLEQTQPAIVPLGGVLNGVVQAGAGTVSSFSGGIAGIQGDPGFNKLECSGTTIESSGLVEGMSVIFQSGVSQNVVATISSMTNFTVGTGVSVVFDSDVNTGGVSGHFLQTEAQFTANSSYIIDNIEFHTTQVKPPDSYLKSMPKQIDYTFLTYTTFYDSLPAGERRHQVDIDSVASRAKAIFSVIYDATEEDDVNRPSYFLGSDPDTLKLNSVQYFINNKLMPLQSYNPQRHSDRPQTFNELSKAFSSINMPLKSFGDASGANLDGYSNTFLVARELARGSMSYNLRDSKPQLRLGFSGTRTNISRINTYVWSEKTIRASPDGLQILQ